MVVIGGRTNQVGDVVNLEVYDTETSEWFKFPCVQRFRHASWFVDNFIFIHGGFEHEMPNIPTGTLFRIDTNQLFSKHKNLGARQKIEPSVKSKDPPPRLANTVLVYMGADTGNEGVQEEFGELVRKVSIDRLQEESKRLGLGPQTISPKKVNQMEKLVDYFLKLLLKPNDWKNEPLEFPFKSSQVEQLIDEVIMLLQKENSLLRIRSPVKIFGDLHGQYQDTMRFFELWGAPNEVPGEGDIESFDYLFLGDYVGRGSNYCIELLLTLFALKVKYPDQIHLLRGHYDDKKYASSIFNEVLAKFPNQSVEDPNSIAFKIYNVFDWLPLAAVVEDRVLCVHGGLGQTLKSLADIEAIQKPISLPSPPEPPNLLLSDILMSDPCDNENETGIQPNIQRDPNNEMGITKFGPDRIKSFLSNNGLSLLIRSHQCVLDGYERYAQGDCLTVFSCTNYCNKLKNAGSVLLIKKSFEIMPKLLYPLQNNDKINWNIERPASPPRRKYQS